MELLLRLKNTSRFLSIPILLIIVLFNLSACSTLPLSYYDETTYRQLTSLKAETVLLVESFDIKPYSANENKIEDTTLSLRKAYEYEKGKGEPNTDSIEQFDKVYKLFIDDVKDYKENGPGELGNKYFQEAAAVLGQSFDILIATENLKNKE